ncbi:MAG TPA: hypothetical protein VFE46_15970 [Pirellulales bacterium]|jgi:hypothetical protein|nr:hypothetical protein [Pirellulales bacterium]
MCLKNRFYLAVAVSALCCSSAWLIAAGTAKAEDQNTPALQSNQPDNQPTEQASDPSSAAPVQSTEPQPIQLSGKGRQASEKFQLQPGLCVIELNHDGDSNVIVKLLDSNGKELDTVFNQIGRFNGQRAINVPKGGTCLLDVQADGNWSANIRQPRTTEGQGTPCTLEGRGYKATPFFKLDKGLAEFKLKHQGEERFKVVLLDQNGRPIEYLINTIGPFDGSKPVSIEEPGLYFLNVSADGNWTVDVQ